MNTFKLTRDSIFLVILIICSQISIPIPFVPLTLQTFAIGIIASILSFSESILVIFCYLLMGCMGLPVFANFSGGLSILLSPLGGYLLGFVLYIILVQLILKSLSINTYSLIFANMIGATVQLLLGTIWLAYYSNLSVIRGLTIGFIPFLIPGLIKIYLVVIIAKKVLRLNLFRIS